MPWMAFIAKVGTSLTFGIAFFVSYTNPVTFPLLKRSTGIGICNFVARFCTVFAPMIAELDKPIPISVHLGVTVLGLIVAFFFPTYS